MCGRFVLATRPETLAEHFGARLGADVEELVAPSWNVAPSRSVLAVTCSAQGGRELGAFRWGLIPAFAKDPSIGNRLVNARAETLAAKPAFRSAFQRRRALIVADGFYEWRKDPDGVRQPFYFSRRDGEPLAFAGLFALWRADADAPWIRSCTIITTDAGPDVASVHDRMPAVLEPAAQEAWLEASRTDPQSLAPLLAPSAAGTLVAWPVDRRVGNPRSDGPELLAPAGPTAREEDGQLSFPVAGGERG